MNSGLMQNIMSHKARGTNGLHGDVACVNLFLIYLKVNLYVTLNLYGKHTKNKNGSSYFVIISDDGFRTDSNTFGL